MVGAVGAAVGDGDAVAGMVADTVERERSREPSMSLNISGTRIWQHTFFIVAIVAAMLTTAQAGAADSKPQPAPTKQPGAKQRTYGSPEEAVKDLVAAVRTDDVKALLAILGPGAKAIVSSGDTVSDREDRQRFAKSWEEASKLEKSGDSRVVLSTGNDAWPFPIPIVKDGETWRFDAPQGKRELLNRRIGRNELSAVQSALAYVDAQREYYLRDPQNRKLLQYAQRFVSSQGRRDGLYYPTKAGEEESPLGPLFDSAKAVGYIGAEGAKASPSYYGYHYRILKGQGPDAPDGAYDYVANGAMIGGHALIAWPATWGNSGIMTFIVSHSGVVYQKNLGPNTSSAAQKITKFNPDSSWRRVDDK